MTTQTTRPAPINGPNTTALGGLIDLLKENPEGGRVTFASHSGWRDGVGVDTIVMGYRIDGQMQGHDERSHVMLADEPLEVSGRIQCPTLWIGLGTQWARASPPRRTRTPPSWA